MNTAFVLSGFLMIIGAVGVFRSMPELGTAARWTGIALLALPGLGGVPRRSSASFRAGPLVSRRS